MHIDTVKSGLEQARLAGFIYQHNQELLVLQEPLNDHGTPLNVFVQDELSSDQTGIQFGLKIIEQHISFLVGVTHSNQDNSYEFGTWNLKGDQKAFNLQYAFYNYPKGFYLVTVPLIAGTTEMQHAMESQLFQIPQLNFLNTALKTSPKGEQYLWIKSFILQQSLDMKVRIQTALL